MPNEAGKRSDTAFIGHPMGLAWLSASEFWERFSYYGMQSLLVLYGSHYLLQPGHVEKVLGFNVLRGIVEALYGANLSPQALAIGISGLYSACVYLTPIGGGLLADRGIGRTRTVVLGATLMTIGQFMLAFDAGFAIGLLCLLLGVGCFKGNIASQVGSLYAPGDLRRADAFQIYFLFINGAVIAAPLVAGTLGEVYGWHYGFGAAGVGMLISLAVYLSGRKWLAPQQEAPKARSGARPGLSRDERIAVLVLILLLPILAIGAVGNQQIFNAYLLWVPSHVDLVFFGRTMPTTWLITLDSAVSISALVAAVAFWRLWARRFREPSEVVKIIVGLGISASAQLALVAAATISAAGHKASVGWVLAFEILNSIGFANVFPVGLALYARASPKAIAGTMIGVYYLHLFMGNNLVGWLGGLLERLPGTQFWLLHAALVGGAAFLMLLAWRLFGHLLAPTGAGDN